MFKRVAVILGFVALAAAMGSVGCGQKGPLVLPQPEQAPAPAETPTKSE